MKNEKSTLRINSFMMLVFLVLAVLIAGCAPASSVSSGQQVEASPAEQQTNIKIVGYGEALGQPDQAQVTVGVETFAPKVNDATAENEDVIAAILGALEDTGIASEDIQTSNYSLWAEQRYGDNGPEGIAGYRVSNQVNVVIRDIEKVGDALAAVTAAGANNIYGVQFSVADPLPLEAEAREKALEDAHQRAESLARLSGLTLGSIVAIDETLAQFPGLTLQMGAGGRGGSAEESTSISPGQLSYQSQVQVTFAISE
ncbi:MAG: SIMPL domain-containing protein [Chloroflexota bacterium]|jgi:hypothetical protein